MSEISETEIKSMTKVQNYIRGYKDGKTDVLDKIRAEITDCLKALDEIEKLGFNICLPNEMSGRRLTYQQCLDIIDKHRAEVESKK